MWCTDQRSTSVWWCTDSSFASINFDTASDSVHLPDKCVGLSIAPGCSSSPRSAQQFVCLQMHTTLWCQASWCVSKVCRCDLNRSWFHRWWWTIRSWKVLPSNACISVWKSMDAFNRATQTCRLLIKTNANTRASKRCDLSKATWQQLVACAILWLGTVESITLEDLLLKQIETFISGWPWYNGRPTLAPFLMLS